MVMQPAAVFWVGGANPGRATCTPPPPPPAGKSMRTRIRTAVHKLIPLCYHSPSSYVLAISFPTAGSLLSENF